MSTNYGGSRTSQMLVGSILPFPALHFCFSETGEKKPQRKKKKRKGETAFQWVDQQLWLVPVPMFPWLLCGVKN
jgi:hypothetical protein